jgi:uracil-DNA glycosylase
MCQAGPDYHRGVQHPGIAIIGACPGASEDAENRPFIGPAGANLAVMVSIINGISSAKFPSANRDDYTLLKCAFSAEICRSSRL